MKAYLHRSILTLIIFLTFILLPPYLFVQPAYADSACAQGMSKDSQRLANYLKVIQGYLAEVKGTINTGDGGKEYIAELLMKKNGYAGIGDYITLPSGALSREYETFIRKIDQLERNFDGPDRAESPAMLSPAKQQRDKATGSLAYDEGTSELFTYQKMGESPYEGGYDERNSDGQNAAKNYANMLRNRNSALVSALNDYLTAVEYKLKSILQLSPNSKAPAELFYIAKEGVSFAYSATKSIRKIYVTLANNRFERNKDFYQAYATYYNACTDALIGAFGSVTGGNIIYHGYDIEGPSRYYWVESTQGGKKTDWTKYVVGSQSGTEHEWAWDKDVGAWKWKVTEYDDGPSVGALPNAVGGRFNIGEIKTKTEEGRKMMSADGVTPIIPDSVREEISGKYADSYQPYNALYAGVKSAQATLATTLNSALDKYKHSLPYSEKFSSVPEAYVEATGMYGVSGYYSIPTAINSYVERQNSPPVADAGVYAAKKIPSTFILNPANASDPDGDNLEFRWIITSIPETEESKSSQYVLYQRLPGSRTTSIIPDLSGNWEVTLEVNDGKTVIEVSTSLTAIRHILWLQHSDKAIALIDTGSDGKKYDYYLEASPDETGMYLNYNDNGKPVDKDIQYQPPSGEGKYCFKIRRDPDFLDAGISGAYDGKFGSTNLVDEKVEGKDSPNIFRRELRLPVFKSAYGAKNKSSYILLESPVSLFVKVLDPQITDLVLATQDCPYGRKISSPDNVSRLQGTYDIEQWVDHDTWFNDHESAGGQGFLQFPGPNGVPDWMEKRAVETLNNYTEALPYVEQIEIFPDPQYTGKYDFGTKTININPGHHSIRYNSSSQNRYGFFSNYDLDATARHEAFHALYWHTVIGSKIYADRDTDLLPREGPFDYLLDSANNKYGGYGPLIDRVKGEFSYRGDGETDVDKGKLKRGWGLLPVQDINRLAYEYIQLPKCLPINIPVNLKMFFIMRKDSSRRYVEPQYTYKLIRQKTPAPEIGIKFSNNAQWVKQIRKNEGEGYVFEPVLYFNYTIRTPHEIQEYDASLIEPGDYTGRWR